MSLCGRLWLRRWLLCGSRSAGLYRASERGTHRLRAQRTSMISDNAPQQGFIARRASHDADIARRGHRMRPKQLDVAFGQPGRLRGPRRRRGVRLRLHPVVIVPGEGRARGRRVQCEGHGDDGGEQGHRQQESMDKDVRAVGPGAGTPIMRARHSSCCLRPAEHRSICASLS